MQSSVAADRKKGDYMGQFGVLLWYEWKKIWRRKSTWITLSTIVLFSIFMAFMEETELQEGRKISGEKINDALLAEIPQAYVASDQNMKNNKQSDADAAQIGPYLQLQQIVRKIAGGYGTAEYSNVTEKELYAKRYHNILQAWEQYGLTKEEKAYWQEKEDRLHKPFTYEYFAAYDCLISMSGVYRVYLFITFLIAICISGVFTEEHERRTDQLILCSKLGRKQIYFAKIAAGGLFSAVTTAVLLLCSVLSYFYLYGTDGFTAAVQLYAPHYSQPVTMGQVFLIMAGILFLAAVLTGIFTMVLSETLRNSLVSMAFVIALMFAARLIPIPRNLRILSQVWNFIPINLLKFDAGFWDLRLVPIFFAKFTSWQFAPVLYLFLTIILVWFGKKMYCSYQV